MDKLVKKRQAFEAQGNRVLIFFLGGLPDGGAGAGIAPQVDEGDDWEDVQEI